MVAYPRGFNELAVACQQNDLRRPCRAVLTGDSRPWLDDVASELSAHDGSAWSIHVVEPLCTISHTDPIRRPDVALVHASKTQPGHLRDALEWLKVSARVPVLLISAPSDVEVRLLSLMRVDDHAVEPVEMQELHARLDRLARPRPDVHRATLGDLTVDGSTREATRGGQHVRLTPTEFGILSRLAASPNEPVAVEELAAAAGLDLAKRNTVQVHISTLRRKLEHTGPPLIHTANGRGYYLRPTVEKDVEQRLALLARRERLLKEREEALARRVELLRRMETGRRNYR